MGPWCFLISRVWEKMSGLGHWGASLKQCPGDQILMPGLAGVKLLLAPPPSWVTVSSMFALRSRLDVQGLHIFLECSSPTAQSLSVGWGLFSFWPFSLFILFT